MSKAYRGIASIAFIVTLALAGAALAEQTCDPACGSGEHCVCKCAETQATCDPATAPSGCDCRCECKD